MNAILAAIVGYLLGSIPFGLLLTRIAGHGDIRDIGSGSIGATNVLRTGNKTLAALTLVFDVLKGSAAVLVGAAWSEEAALAGGAAVDRRPHVPGVARLSRRQGGGDRVGGPHRDRLAGGARRRPHMARHRGRLPLFLARRPGRRGGQRRRAPVFVVDRPRAALIALIAILVVLRHRQNVQRLMAGTESRISFREG